MCDVIRKLKNKTYAFYIKARGKKRLEFKLFGVQIFLIAQPDKWHTNFFVLYIPILRIDHEATKFGINFLILTWLYKVIKYLFTKWKFVKKEDEIQLLFCGMNIYHRKDVVPYKFPVIMFKG